MKRAFVVAAVAVLTSVGFASAASAENQPSQGEHSSGRNPAAVAGGPHCHVLVVNSEHGPFVIEVFPSHTAHIHTGLSDGVFAAAQCDEIA